MRISQVLMTNRGVQSFLSGVTTTGQLFHAGGHPFRQMNKAENRPIPASLDTERVWLRSWWVSTHANECLQHGHIPYSSKLGRCMLLAGELCHWGNWVCTLKNHQNIWWQKQYFSFLLYALTFTYHQVKSQMHPHDLTGVPSTRRGM